jgi:hypothetical protein
MNQNNEDLHQRIGGLEGLIRESTPKGKIDRTGLWVTEEQKERDIVWEWGGVCELQEKGMGWTQEKYDLA